MGLGLIPSLEKDVSLRLHKFTLKCLLKFKSPVFFSSFCQVSMSVDLNHIILALKCSSLRLSSFDLLWILLQGWEGAWWLGAGVPAITRLARPTEASVTPASFWLETLDCIAPLPLNPALSTNRPAPAPGFPGMCSQQCHDPTLPNSRPAAYV